MLERDKGLVMIYDLATRSSSRIPISVVSALGFLLCFGSFRASDLVFCVSRCGSRTPRVLISESSVTAISVRIPVCSVPFEWKSPRLFMCHVQIPIQRRTPPVGVQPDQNVIMTPLCQSPNHIQKPSNPKFTKPFGRNFSPLATPSPNNAPLSPPKGGNFTSSTCIYPDGNPTLYPPSNRLPPAG